MANDVIQTGVIRLRDVIASLRESASFIDEEGEITNDLEALVVALSVDASDAAQRTDLVPGVMRCAKCEFQLVRITLAVNLGKAVAGNSETEPCPNGCGPLWPVTWEQYARQMQDAADTMAERAIAAEKALDADPLQGAANWLVQVHVAISTSTLMSKLSIGFNRAQRLYDAAIVVKQRDGAV